MKISWRTLSRTSVLPHVGAWGRGTARRVVVVAALVAVGLALSPWMALAQGAAEPPIGLRRDGPPPAQSSPKPAPQRMPVRQETTPFDNWTMSCQEELPAPGARGGKKTCWGTLRVSDAKTQQVVLAWLIGKDGQGAPTIAVQTPTGIMVGEGVEVSFGGNVRKLAYRWCDQSACEASAPFDAVFARSFGSQKEATASFRLRDGRQVAVKASIVGADRLVAALPR